MSPVANKETKALYFISKEAKKKRDLHRSIRNKLKSHLFHHADLELSEEEEELFEEYGVKNPGYYKVGELDYTNFSDLKKDPFYTHLRRTEIDAFYDYIVEGSLLSFEDEEIFIELFYSGTFSGMDDFTDMLLSDKGISEDGIRDIMFEVEYAKSMFSDIKIAQKKNNTMHNFLDDGTEMIDNQKEALYDLKSCVLYICPEKPIAFHNIKGEEDHYGAYYVIHGYKFHTFVEYDDIDIDLLDDKVNISNISAVNIIDTEMTLEEAIKILLDYLGTKEINIDDILKGKVFVSEVLDIPIVTPKWTRSKTQAYDNDFYDDDFDDGYYDDEDWP